MQMACLKDAWIVVPGSGPIRVPAGYQFAVPRDGFSNLQLARAAAGDMSVWLNWNHAAATASPPRFDNFAWNANLSLKTSCSSLVFAIAWCPAATVARGASSSGSTQVAIRRDVKETGNGMS